MSDDAKGLNRRNLMMATGALLTAGMAGLSQARAADGPAMTLPRAWTEAEVLHLWPDGPPESGYKAEALPDDWPGTFIRNVAEPTLHVFRPAKPNGGALLVMPGGAYWFVSIQNEGVDVANAMTQLGYTVFVLVYRLPGEGWTQRTNVPLQDAQRAMRLIRAHSSDYQCDPHHVAALGFSAGGHLAASLTTNFGETVYEARDAVDRQDARPFASGLIYPVISMQEPVTHAQSANLLLGPEPSQALVAHRSPAQHVSGDTPPVFLMHALDDPAVPPRNSLLMMEALREAGRPVEAHFFEEGGHGFGLGAPELPAHQWISLYEAWLDRHIRKS